MKGLQRNANVYDILWFSEPYSNMSLGKQKLLFSMTISFIFVFVQVSICIPKEWRMATFESFFEGYLDLMISEYIAENKYSCRRGSHLSRLGQRRIGTVRWRWRWSFWHAFKAFFEMFCKYMFFNKIFQLILNKNSLNNYSTPFSHWRSTHKSSTTREQRRLSIMLNSKYLHYSS